MEYKKDLALNLRKKELMKFRLQTKKE